MVDLLFGVGRYDARRKWMRAGFRFAIRSEFGVNEVAVAFDVVERLPDDAALGEKALVGHQREQLVLKRKFNRNMMSDMSACSNIDGVFTTSVAVRLAAAERDEGSIIKICVTSHNVVPSHQAAKHSLSISATAGNCSR